MKNDSTPRETLARPESGIRVAAKLLERDTTVLATIEKLHKERALEHAASRAKTQFLVTISEELRRPLNAMLGFAQLLDGDAREPLSEKQRQRVDQIMRGGEHARRLLDGVIELCQLDMDPPVVHCEATHVVDAIADVQRSLEPLASRRAIRIEVAPSIDDVPTLWLDRSRLRRVLAILGTNGVQYNRIGGTVTFAVDFDRPEHVRFTVQDTGNGMSADMRGRIFDLAREGRDHTEGRGLGLVIAKRIAALMGGDLDVRSAVGVGSWFWLDLPLITIEPSRRDSF